MDDNTGDNTSADEDTTASADQPDHRPSRTRERQAQPDAYTVGYDPDGSTRVGVGAANRGTRLRRLIRQNEGRHRSDGRHSTREAARDKKRVTQSFCSVLAVTAHQQREAVSIMGQLNLDRFGQQKRLEKIALGVIRIVVDLDRRRIFFDGRDPSAVDMREIDISSYPPSLGDDKRYRLLCAHHGVSDEDRFSVSRLIKDELQRIGYFDDANDRRDSEDEVSNI